MVCYHPRLVSIYSDGGKKRVVFHKTKTAHVVSDNDARLPCGQCIGCRLANSRDFALRCMHEASLYSENTFLTLTYRDECYPKDGSLDHRHVQLFMKRLRSAIAPRKVRVYGCGEYGGASQRAHYHLLLFGYYPHDRRFYKKTPGGRLYTSAFLEGLWGKGYAPFGSLTLQSAGYVARYCTKKITGKAAADHYKGRKPEYSINSNKPGIGADWLAKFESDVYPSDFLVMDGQKFGIPRYYDKLIAKKDSVLLEHLKIARRERALLHADDQTDDRLAAAEAVARSKFDLLIRTLEAGL